MRTMPTTPISIPLCLEEEVKQLRWVLWNWVKAADGRLTKPPYRVDHPTMFARPNDPTTWACGMAALKAYALGVADGIGYALMNSGIGAVDLDDCRDLKTGELAPWAQQLLEKCGTYAEITPSGTGLRIIGKVNGGTLHRKFPAPDGGSVEVYRNDAARYITVTGNSLTPAVTQLGNIDGLLDGIVAEFGGKKKTGGSGDGRTLEDLILNGCGTSFGGDHSRATWRVIHLMLAAGVDREEIAETLTNSRYGISTHCLSKPGDPVAYALRQIDKAIDERAEDAEAEIERLAGLSSLKFEKERKLAAERLGVRASVLDRLVSAKRAGLGSADKQDEPQAGPVPVLDGVTVLGLARDYLKKYVAYPSHHALVAHTLWCAHTYLLMAFDSTPRIAFLSQSPASGKTRAVEASEPLVYRPICTVNASANYLFRKTDEEPPSVLFDEIDCIFGPRAKEHDDVRGYINAGHRKGATYGRCQIAGSNVLPVDSPCYAAVLMAGLGWLPDTLLSRSIIVRMHPRLDSQKITAFRTRTGIPEGKAIGAKLAAWAKSVFNDAVAARPEMPKGIVDRQADAWEPLMVVADLAGGDWPELAREAAIALVKVNRKTPPSLPLRLLRDSRLVFFENLTAVEAVWPDDRDDDERAVPP
jgi:hypothetical protein